MKFKLGMAVAAATIALLSPAAALGAHPEQLVRGVSDGPGAGPPTHWDITTTHGHATFPDPTIVNHLVGLIGRAPSGSNIHTNVYRVETDDPVMVALRAAQADRGVNVHVVYHGASDSSPADAFDWVPAARRWTCSNGCHNETNPDGKAHSKYFLFDNTRRTDAPSEPAQRAVWISSANLNRGSGSSASNFATTFWSDNAMYDGMRHVWDDSFREVRCDSSGANCRRFDGDFYKANLGWNPWYGVVHSPDAGSVAHISPDDDGPDMWGEQLRPLNSGSGCVVRVMQAQIADTGPAGARAARAPVGQLERLAGVGCAIRVLVGEKTDPVTREVSADIDPKSKEVLCGLVRTTNTELSRRPRMHDKGVAVFGTYDGGPDRYQVFSGSHNWTDNAWRDNDEVLLRMADSRLAFETFREHFYDNTSRSSKDTPVAC